MKESIFISNFRNNAKNITNYILDLKRHSRFEFSSIHKKNDVLQIILNDNNYIDPIFINKYKLTCVIENELFRTVYLKGTRIMWKSLHD